MQLSSYLITDPYFYTSDPDTFRSTLFKSFDYFRPNYVCFRDKTSTNQEQLAKILIECCQAYQIENSFINGDIALALSVKAKGVHLRSSQLNEIGFAKEQGLVVTASCHNALEIEKSFLLGADFVTYSPIFASPNKGTPLGVEALQRIVEQSSGKKIIALGGIISQKEVDEIQKTNAFGFASIRFWLEENSLHSR